MSWLSDLASQAVKFADGLADNIVAEANKAQQVMVAEQNKIKEELKKHDSNENALLPWETDDESRSIVSQDLMERILILSLSENNFIVLPRGFDLSEFQFNDFVPIAMKLLSLDSNLARVHAKLMPKMNEEDFWCHYYFRIKYLRLKSKIDDCSLYDKKFTFSDEEESTIIYPPDSSGDILQRTAPNKMQTGDMSVLAVSTSASNTKETKSRDNKTDSNDDTNAGKSSLDRERRKKQDEDLAAEVQAELGNDPELDLELDDLDMDLDMEGLDIDGLDDQDLIDDILTSDALDKDKEDADYDKL